MISLMSKGLSKVFSKTTVGKCQFLWHSAFCMVQFSHLYMTTGKTVTITIYTFISKAISLYISILFQILFPYRLLENIKYSSLCYIVGPFQLSILFIVVYICPPQSSNLSLLSTFPFGNHRFDFKICLFLICQ